MTDDNKRLSELRQKIVQEECTADEAAEARTEIREILERQRRA